MKILHLTDHLPNYHKTWGGAEQVAYRYIRLLSDFSHDDILVGSVKPKEKIEENFKFVRIWTIEDFFPVRYGIFITGIKNRILSFDLLAFFYLIYVYNKEKPDVVHIHKANKISFSAILAAKIFSIRTVLGIYDYWYFCPGGMLMDQKGNLCTKFHGAWCKNCDAVSDYRGLSLLLSPLRRQIFDFFYQRIDAFAVLSEAQGNLLKSYGIPKKKIVLVRQVFNLFNTKPDFNGKKNMILFTGWLDQRKGLHILIEAMPEIIRKIPRAGLFILKLEGTKSYEDKVMKRISKLNLQNKVKILGRLTKEEFGKFMKQASVVVVPEQWENMSPVIIVEGMAQGKVMVASKIGGIPEFIKDGENGLLAQRDSPKDFAEKVIWVLKNPSEARKLAIQASIDIRKLCEEKKVLRDLLRIYNKLSYAKD